MRAQGRDARLLLAAGLAAVALGSLSASCGVLILQMLPGLMERSTSLQGQAWESGEPLPAILPVNVGQVIRETEAFAMRVIVAGLVGISGGIFLLFLFDRAALSQPGPRRFP